MILEVCTESSSGQNVNQPMSRGAKFFFILLVGLIMVLVINFTRYWSGDITHLQPIWEGLNKAIMLFALGAAVIGWFSSNPDRTIFGRLVFVIGAISTAAVTFSYEMNTIVLIFFSLLAIISSLMVAKIRVPAP